MGFVKYQHLERFGRSAVRGIEVGECLIFPKLDGCFSYGAKVMLADGTSEMIGKIVNQNLDVEVLSYDFKTNKVVPKRITNWFKYDVDIDRVKDEWVTIGVDRNGTQLNSRANSRIKIRTTTNHMIFIKDRESGKFIEIPAKNIKVGDIVYVPAEDLSVIQKQVLLGTLLGDASAYPNKESCYNGVEFTHSIKQSEYVKHKLKLLGFIGNSYREYECDSSFSKEKCNGNTLVNKQTQQVYDICYKNNHKTISREWLDKLNSLGLAVWYMDDGSLHKNIRSEVVTLHVQGFSNKEQHLIVEFLNDRGYEAQIQKAGEYNIVKLNIKGSDKFFTDISQHIIPSMQYKLPIRFQDRYTPLLDDVDTSISLQERKVISVKSGVDGGLNSCFHNGNYKYDIEVEGTHNYFCEGIMVHNSNASVWLENGEIKAGSRNRELSYDKDNAGFYKQIVDDINIKSYLNKYPEHRLYGEFLVPHSLKTYEDDAWRKFYVFDICVGGEGDLEYIPYKEYQPILEKFDIDYIPCIATIQDGDFHTFKEYLDTNTYLIQNNKGTGEGLVIKNYDFKNRFGRTVWAKIVCDEFKVKHTETFGESDSEPKKMVEELIVDKFCTDAFIEKEYSKVVHENDGEFEGRDIPRLLNTVWHEFIVEESWNFIKQHRNPTIDYKTLNGLVIDKIKKVKSNEF